MRRHRKLLTRSAGVLVAAVLAGWGGVRAAEPDEKPVSRRPQGTREARLPPGAEDTLRWGKVVNGLRAAVVILRPGGGKADDSPDLYLAVQNVSEAPLRLLDDRRGSMPRELVIKIEGKTQAAIVDPEPTLTDVLLQPRGLALLPVLTGPAAVPAVRTAGSLVAEDALKDPSQTLLVELRSERKDTLAGTWTGRLRTGETTAKAASPAPSTP
jgi:hypothetical protein